MTRRTPTADAEDTTTAAMAALTMRSTANPEIPAARAPSLSKAVKICSFQETVMMVSATRHTRIDSTNRSGVTSRRRPNISASSWPDRSPLYRESTIPAEKNEVRTTAVPDSDTLVFRLPTAVRAMTMNTAQIAAPGMIMSSPP